MLHALLTAVPARIAVIASRSRVSAAWTVAATTKLVSNKTQRRIDSLRVVRAAETAPRERLATAAAIIGTLSCAFKA